MTTATGEYTSSLPPRLSALSISGHPAAAADHAPSSSPPPAAALGDDNAAGTRPGAAATPPRKAWKSPPTRLEEEELRSSWPVPSRDGDLGRKKPAQFSQQPVLVSRRLSGAPATPPPPSPSSSPETASEGDPINIAFDPHQKQMRGTETWEEKRRASNPPAIAATSVDNNSSRAARPPLLPVPRQGRPPQNGRRGRGHHHFPHHNHHHGGNYSGGHQQQRPRHHWNALSFPPRQPTQIINDNFYHPMDQPLMGIPNLPQDWGFNTMPVLQWDPNPHLAPPYIAPPTENMFHRGYFPGPYFPEAFPHSAAPLSPIPPPPPPGWNPPWFMGPPPGEAVLQNQPPNPPLPSPQHQAPVVNTQQDDVDVDMRLRKQIEYYFSDENLMKDGYLKMCMDNQGWVSVHVIATFPRVQRLSRDVGFILGALQTSSIVEVSVDKMRRKGEWNRWIIRQHVLDGNREAPEG